MGLASKMAGKLRKEDGMNELLASSFSQPEMA